MTILLKFSYQFSYRSINKIFTSTLQRNIKRNITAGTLLKFLYFQTLFKDVLNEQGRSLYLKLFGSPTFQFSNVIGLPLAIQKKVPSSAWSVPEVQKCSCPRPKSLICFSSLSFSSCDAILARCIPWYRQYCDALYQLACNEIYITQDNWNHIRG